MERRLEATKTARAHFERSSGVLLEDPSQLFSSVAGSEARRARCFPTEVTVDLGGGVTAGEGGVVELGLPTESGGAVVVDLVWRPVSHSHVLPVFHGSLEFAPAGSHTRLHLHGTYRPPLGPVGAFVDGLLGHRLARQSIATFLRTVAQRTDDEVDRRSATEVGLATYPLDVRDLPERPQSAQLKNTVRDILTGGRSGA